MSQIVDADVCHPGGAADFMPFRRQMGAWFVRFSAENYIGPEARQGGNDIGCEGI
jgi:hypothetical protein